jgi:hypothetical protein
MDTRQGHAAPEVSGSTDRGENVILIFRNAMELTFGETFWIAKVLRRYGIMPSAEAVKERLTNSAYRHCMITAAGSLKISRPRWWSAMHLPDSPIAALRLFDQATDTLRGEGDDEDPKMETKTEMETEKEEDVDEGITQTAPHALGVELMFQYVRHERHFAEDQTDLALPEEVSIVPLWGDTLDPLTQASA